MSEDLDKVLLKADRIQRVYELLRSYGADEQQAHVGSTALAEKFTWTGSVLTFNVTGKLAVDDPACREYIAKDYAFLLPPPKAADAPNVDPELLALAKAGNMTARSKIFVAVGRDGAKLDALMTETKPDVPNTPDKPAPKQHKGINPWSQEHWNISAQGKLIREIGLAAATGIAKSADSYVGATRPSRAA